MEESYDVVICGTGLSECILSGQLSKEQKKVLHIDRNRFYGGESASLNITNMWNKFRGLNEKPPQHFGANRDWNIDQIPKYVMANGNLVKILLKTRVAKYLEWKAIDGTYVLQMREAGYITKGGAVICKVPATDTEALNSDLMGMLEKRRCKNFFVFVQTYDVNDKKTHQEGWTGDLKKSPFSELVKYFALEANTIDFIGHAVALYTDDSFLNLPSDVVLDKIRLYMDSIGRYGDSPFIYPIYGLGGIPEGFSRMCAIYGGTFMLEKDIDKILFDSEGNVSGVESQVLDEQEKKEGEESSEQKEQQYKTVVTPCKTVICSPDYAIRCGLKERVKASGEIVRIICLMDHPIPKTKDVPSIQIILPQRQTKRKSDIYISMTSNTHQTSKKGFYVTIISGMVETKLKPEEEFKDAFDLIGPVLETFVNRSTYYEPVPHKNDGLFITKSMDSTSHFESATQDVLDLYQSITGRPFDLVVLPEEEEDQ